MKRFSSILLAAIVATLMLVSNARAQQVVVAAGDWQNALATWNTPTFPGQLNDNTIAQTGPTAPAAITLTNAGGVANRVRALQVQGATNLTLQGTGSLTIGALNLNSGTAILTIGAGLNVIIDSVIDGSAGSTIVVQSGGKFTLRKGANAPAQQVLLGGTLLAAGNANGEVIIENGFNGGNFPTNIFYASPPAVGAPMTCLNAITVNAPMSVGENINVPAAAGIFTVNGGVLQVTPGGSLQLDQTGLNSLQGTGTLNAQVGGVVILGNGFSAGIVPGQRFSNPFTGELRLNGAANSNFTLNSSMTFSPPNPTTAQQAILNLNGTSPSTLTVPAGVTVRFNNTINNGLQAAGALNQVLVNAGGTVILGNGFNAGVIPGNRFGTINGTLQTVGPMSLNVTGGINPFSSTGQFEIGGDLSLAGAGTFELSQTGPNSLRATTGSNARISAPGRNTIVRFNANANNGVLPGCLFSDPFSGGIDIRSSQRLSCDLSMGTDAGPIRFDATTVGVNTNIILTVDPNVSLALRQNSLGNVTAVVAAATPVFCYIQGANNTARVILGLGANGGTVPGVAMASIAPGVAPVTPLLPLSGVATFNGRLVLEGSLTFAANLAMGTGSILDLAGGNFTVQGTRTLRLLNSSPNSLIGTGVIQATAPILNDYRHINQGVLAGGAAVHGSAVEIGPSFNGTIFPAVRFASPFQGNIVFSTAGAVTIQGNFVHGIPGGTGYFVVGDITSNANITIAQNSSVRLNTINPSAFIGSPVVNPPVPAFPGGAFQGIDQTSRLEIGPSHGNSGNNPNNGPPAASTAFAVTTTGNFLATPFNGTLAFASNTIIYTSATIGVTGGLELGGLVIVTSGTRYGAGGTYSASGHNRVHPNLSPTGQLAGVPAAPIPYLQPITITLNNQAAGSIAGLGTFLTATGNTLVFGPNANGGIIPGNRLESPHFGTIATVGQMTLQGNLTFGDLRDGYVDRLPTLATPLVNSSGFLKLGDRLLIDNGAVLTVSNATAQAFSTRFAGNASEYQVSTSGTGVIQANKSGELRILDGYNARNAGAGNSSAFTVTSTLTNGAAAGASSNRQQASLYIPLQSFFHPGFLASPFNGRLFFGSDMPQAGASTLVNRSLTGGFSRFNITTGTLTIGTDGFLGLISPLYVSSGTVNFNSLGGAMPVIDKPRLSDGYPRVILNQTDANSFVGTTTGSFIQSSVGSFAPGFNLGAPVYAQFFMSHMQGNNVTGGSVVLGPGFNGGIIPGNLFGSPLTGTGPSRAYSGRLVMPQTGSLTLTGVLTMNTWFADDANYGIFHLGDINATSVLNVQDGATLSLGTTGTVTGAIFPGSRGSGFSALPASPGTVAAATAPQGQGVQSARALQGAGRIQGLGNNARIIIPGNMNDGFITAANFSLPFNGRMVISTGNTLTGSDGGAQGLGGFSRMFLVGDLVFGDVGTSNGILEIQAPTYTATNITNRVAPQLVLAGAGGGTMWTGPSVRFNNISPAAVVLPGNGFVVSTSNFGRVVIGPNALANTIPAAQLLQPFVGQLIVTTGSTSPFVMNSSLTLAADDATSVLNTIDLYGRAGDRAGYLRTAAPIKLGSNVALNVYNTAAGTLSGGPIDPIFGVNAGALDATDVSSVVRYFVTAGAAGIGAAPANAGVIGTTVQSQLPPATALANLRFATSPFGGFSNPWLGTIQTDIAHTVTLGAAVTPARNVYHLYGRLVLGTPGSSNGVFNASGATIVLAGADIGAGALGVNSTVANLVVNNISSMETVLPGAGLFSVRGLTNGATPAAHGHPLPMAITNGPNGNTAGGNASMAFGPNALSGGTLLNGVAVGRLPNHRWQMNYHNGATHNPLLGAMGNAIGGDQRAAAAFHDIGTAAAGASSALPNPGIRGTIITSTGTMIATTGNMRFSSGGTLLIGGVDPRYTLNGVAPAATSIAPLNAFLNIPDNVTVTIATLHRSAFGGQGALMLGGTNSTLVFGGNETNVVGGDGGNDGVIYAQHIGGGQTIGRVVINRNAAAVGSNRTYTELRGNLRFGDGANALPGSSISGHLAFTTANAQLMIGTNSTLNFASTKVVAVVSNPTGVAPNGNNVATGVAFAALPTGLLIGPGGATAFAGSPGANSGTTSSVVVFGPQYARFRHRAGNPLPDYDRTFAPPGNASGLEGLAAIDQAYPMLDNRNGVSVNGPNFGHTGVIITSTGTIAITNGNFALLGQLEMGGPVNVEGSRTAQFNNVAANSFRATAGSNGHLRANPDGIGATSAASAFVVLGPNVTADLPQLALNSFNNGVLPANLLGRSRGGTTNGLPIDGEVTNTFGATRATARLQINSSNLTLSGGSLYMYGDLEFSPNGGDINIPTGTQLTINGGFTHAAPLTRPGVITGVDRTSVLAFAPVGRFNGIPLDINDTRTLLDPNSPQIGNRGAAPAVGQGFRGTLRLLSSGFDESLNNTYPVQLNSFSTTVPGSGLPVSNLGISSITVTIATVGGIDMQSTRSSIVLERPLVGGSSGRLDLNNNTAGSFMPSLVALQGATNRLRVGTTAIIALGHGVGNTVGVATTATVSFGSGFNGGFVPGNLLSSPNLQAGPQFVMNSSLELSSPMFVATSGSWSFNTPSTNKLTLGAHNMTVHGQTLNADQNRYYITNGAGVVGLNNVGNITFPVGPSATLYTPINIVNNAVASLFSVGAVSPRTAAIPAANATTAISASTAPLASVNAQWNVTQNNNVAPGVAVVVSPQWPTSLQGAGFNAQLATVNRHSATAIVQSSTPSPASPANLLTGYLTSTLVVTQTAIPGSFVSSPITVTSQPTPTITRFTPTSASSSQTVTIIGSRFTGVSAVTLGGTPAVIRSVSAGGDTIVVAVQQGGTGDVVVTQPGGTASLGTFTYLGAIPQTPVIISALPQPIAAGLGDAVVTIRGTGFGNTNVRVVVTGSGLTGSIIPTSSTTTSIVLTVPGQFTRNVGSIGLQVTSTDKNPVSTNVTVAAAPATTLTGITPAPSTAGNLTAHTLSLTGTAFGPQSVFSLNGVPLQVTGFTANPDGTSTARVLVPAGVTSGDIIVTNLNNTTARIPYAVNALPRPAITSVTPVALLPGSPTTLVTISGQNFIPGAVITFNGTSLPPASISATSIGVNVPAELLAQPDLATIRIINPDNQVIGYRFPISTNATTIADPNRPVVLLDSLGNPRSGAITPATTTATAPATAFQITINGSNFRTGTGATNVSLGGTMLTIVSATPTSIVANVPASANVAGMSQLQLANGPSTLNIPYTIGAVGTGSTTGTGTTGVPVVSGIAQDRNRVVINGSNFVTGATVTFGPNRTPLTVVPGTNQLTATLPSPTPDGVYNVTVTNPGGGSVSSTVAITSVVAERLAATRVYPNPTVDVVNVEVNLDRASTVVINVTNTLGQVVMTVRTNAGAGFFAKSLNVANLPSGAYNIEVTDGTRRSIEKIIKN
ncbi:MAG: T9SS C-terminal target domain-containing protein [Candidatus Kapaibacterium sp.]|nr:MAG: T9SS C-terminal target domain-containing protein [Candidatus Kapabacteria bacterium]